LNDGSGKKTFEGIEKLELTNDGITIIETLSKDGSESSFKFLDSASELVNVVIESSLLNVHNVILDTSELFNSLVEFVEDLEY
jgi:hypothetical protein